MDFLAKAKADAKYVICNGDEGDPGAYMDRTCSKAIRIRVLEGMMIAGYASGRPRAFFISGRISACHQARAKGPEQAYAEHGLLGKNILEGADSFRP